MCCSRTLSNKSSLMPKHLQRLRIKSSLFEGEDAPIILPWWSLVKGFVLMPSFCQHLVPKLVLLYLCTHVLECSQSTDTERTDLAAKRLCVWLCTARMTAGLQSHCWRERKWATASRVVRSTVSEKLWDATNHKASLNSQAGRAAY